MCILVEFSAHKSTEMLMLKAVWKQKEFKSLSEGSVGMAQFTEHFSFNSTCKYSVLIHAFIHCILTVSSLLAIKPASGLTRSM